MLRVLNENEMEMVSGGHIDRPGDPSMLSANDDPINSIGGAGNEVISYGTRSSLGSSISSGMRGMMGRIRNELFTQGFYDPSSSARSQIADLQRQLEQQQQLLQQQQEMLDFLRNHTHNPGFLDNLLGGGEDHSHPSPPPSNPPG